MQYIKQNKVFIGLCLALFVALGIVLCLVPKADLHLFLSSHHTAAGDGFFPYYTKVAEWFPYIIAILLLLYKAGWSAFFAADAALSSLVGQAVKHLVDAPRPLKYFAENFPDIQLQLVEGVRMNRALSFPSGHTISFFAMCFALSVIVVDYIECNKQRYPNGISTIAEETVQVLFFCLALLGGYSRIYLSQHFAADVCGGAAVSFIVSVILCLLIPRFKDQKWWNWHFFAKKSQKNLVD